MNKAVTIVTILASIAGLITLISAGLKIVGNNYDVVCEGVIIGVCLIVLFVSAIYRASKQK